MSDENSRSSNTSLNVPLAEPVPYRHRADVESVLQRLQNALLIFRVRRLAQILPLRLEYEQVRLALALSRHCDEVRPYTMAIPPAQIVVASLPSRHPVPPRQRSLPVQIPREALLQLAVELIVHRARID